MARNPPEIQPMEGRGLRLLPLTVVGTPVAGCSCNNMEPHNSWSTLLASLFQLPFGHTGGYAFYPALRIHRHGNWTESRSSRKRATASKMACAASSKYLDLAGDGFVAGHPPRCSLVIIGPHAGNLLHAWTSSLVALTCCLHQSWPWTLLSHGTKLLHRTFCIGDLHLLHLYTGNID